MSTQLAQFTDKIHDIARHILASEGHPLVGKPCSCRKGVRTTRCKDCTSHVPSCDTCFLRDHAANPFHFAEKWNGRYFERMSQSDIGRILHLGHEGNPCPSNKTVTLHLDVVHINGVHGCKAMYCECTTRGKHWEQLLDAELFPATLAKPATAFSFGAIKLFDLISTISKTSAMDFVSTLRRLTNNAFTDDVPVRNSINHTERVSSCIQDFYKAFRRIMRIWRTIQMNKRAGVYHGVVDPSKDEFCLALKCPACPQPGFNMPLKFRVEPSGKDR